MSTFKQFLVEGDGRFIDNYDEIVRKLIGANTVGIKDIRINKGGNISISRDIWIGPKASLRELIVPDGNGYRLAIRIRNFGSSVVTVKDLSTLEGLPTIPQPNADLHINSAVLRDYRFIPPEISLLQINCPNTPWIGDKAKVKRTLTLVNASSLTGMQNVIAGMESLHIFRLSNLYSMPLLSLMLVPGNWPNQWSTEMERKETSHQAAEVRKALGVITRRIRAGDRDVMACQEELIDAGLEEYANL